MRIVLITSTAMWSEGKDLGGLVLDHLAVEIGGHAAVRDVSLTVQPSSVHCLVGESGSGKTLTALASVGLLPRGASGTGSVRLGGLERDLLTLGQAQWSELRGRHIGYVGQNALGCLHPAFRVGTQVVEAIRRHQQTSRSDAWQLAVNELAAVDLLDPERVARSFPSQLSGGMCQRVAIAIALCNRPSVLIVDEPTTALDNETQDKILDLLRARVASDNLGVLLITHDQSVVAQVADDTTSIADGRTDVVVSAEPSRVVAAARSIDSSEPGTERGPVLQIDGVSKSYGKARWGRTPVTVLNDVNISADAGSTVGLVGRSGAGKTTLARIVAGVLTPTVGSVRIDGRDVTGPDCVGRNEKANLVQYVFQDPYGSLNPRRTALAQVAEPLVAAGQRTDEAKDQARSLLADVGLDPAQIDRLPTALSGGQCQRVGVARALIRRPSVVVLDEPVSALDWAIRAEIIAILAEQQATTGAMYLLISHERALVEEQSDEVYEIADGVCSSAERRHLQSQHTP